MLENSGNDEPPDVTVACYPEDLLNQDKSQDDEPRDDDEDLDDVTTVDADSGWVELSQSLDIPDVAFTSDDDSSAEEESKEDSKSRGMSDSITGCPKPRVSTHVDKMTSQSQKKTTKDSHNEKQPKNQYSCRFCDFKSTFTIYLEMHFMKLHPKEDPFECEFCSKCFPTCGELKIHRRIHSNEKLHACDVCGARFAWASRMKIHRAIHTDKKPFACDLCDYKSHMLADLKRHQNTHKVDKPFICSICQRKYSSKVALKQHAVTHF